MKSLKEANVRHVSGSFSYKGDLVGVLKADSGGEGAGNSVLLKYLFTL